MFDGEYYHLATGKILIFWIFCLPVGFTQLEKQISYRRYRSPKPAFDYKANQSPRMESAKTDVG
jgi:hypothetical protein